MSDSRTSPGEFRVVLVADAEPARAARAASQLGDGTVWPAATALERIGTAEGADLILLLAGREDLCAEIKRRDPELPVVIVGDARPAAFEAGADEVLSEHGDPVAARKRVSALLARRGRWRGCQSELTALRRLAAFKDDLVSLIVHDLRNPLAGMLGFLSALDEGTRGPAFAGIREDVEGALLLGRKLQEVVSELLQIRMLEEDALAITRTPMGLRELVTSAVSSLEGVARERGVLIAMRVDALAVASLDDRLLRRALENLIANALRYSPRGSRVTVAGRLEGEDAVLEVADAGPGVPDQFKVAVFGKYSSLEAAGTSRKGFGLGLYQVKLAVEAHGGQVHVRDAPDGGALFEMRLPATPQRGVRP